MLHPAAETTSCLGCSAEDSAVVSLGLLCRKALNWEKFPMLKKEKYSPRHGPSQAQTMQALAALPAPHLLQLPEQIGSLGHFTWSYLTCWHFMDKRRFTFPTPLVSSTLGVKT